MKDIALLFMPWASLTMPSLALGLLKSVLEKKDIKTDVHYLNIKLAKHMDKVSYEDISGSTTYTSEWIFAQFLYNEEKLRKGSANFNETFNEMLNEIIDYDYYLYMYIKKRKQKIMHLMQVVIPEFLDECLETIDWSSYKAVGFSCMIGYQLSALLLAKKIKERYKDIKIIFGGPNVREKAGEEIIKNFDFVDYIIDGEGEETLPNLVKNIVEGKFYEEISGVLYRCNGQIHRAENLQEPVDLNELPLPDYKEYYDEIYGAGIDKEVAIKVSFESSRGCWWGQKCQCSFCGLSNGYLNYRAKTADNVMKELMEQSQKYNCKDFFATDLILSSSFYDDLIPELIERKLDLDIFYEIKPKLKKAQIKKLSEAGIKTVQAGVESLNTDLLKLLRKGVSAIQNIHFMKTCEELNIWVKWNLLYRIPGEKKESYDEMLKLIPMVSHLRPPAGGQLIQIALDRFSPYYNNIEKYKIQDIKPKGFYYLSYLTPGIDYDNIAYEFDFTYPDADEIVSSYIEKLALYVLAWQKAYNEKTYHFNYQDNNDIITIEDNRPVSLEQETALVKHFTLEGIERFVFLLCNDVYSFEQIVLIVNDKFNSSINREQLKQVMDNLAQDRLLYEENGMYVNLALDKTIVTQ